MPPEFLMMLLESDSSLPRPDAVSGVQPFGDVATSDELTLEQMLEDPDVLAVVEATDELVPLG